MNPRTRYYLELEPAPGNYLAPPKPPPNTEGQVFFLALKSTGSGWRTNPEIRLRAALKRLLRNYGLRCIAARPGNHPAGFAGFQMDFSLKS